MCRDTIRSVFESRTDLTAHSENGLGLLALQLQLGVEDLQSAAAESIVDGSDDRKCDLVYLDLDDSSSDRGIAVVAQCYMRADWGDRTAPENKATDLMAACSWLLESSLSELPDRIRPSASALRDGITNGQIRKILVWYVHNLNESDNVARTMRQVETTARAHLASLQGGEEVEVAATEVGLQTLDEWYRALETPILVTDEVTIEGASGFEISGPDWAAYVTTIGVRQLRDLFSIHQDKLFSANLRGYLGSRSSDRNINNRIKITARDDPGRFCVYNNGITVIVNDYRVDAGDALVVTGMSIVNGAQTTGAIGSLEADPGGDGRCLIRFVRCSDEAIIKRIIEYNNSQNKLEAPDFRSNDAVQTRLREEFEEIPECSYSGGRRGGAEDVIRRRGNQIPSDTAAQALAALHGNPRAAYHRKSEIWLSNQLYENFFNDQVSARHIVFAYSLLRAIEERKAELRAQAQGGQESLRDVDRAQLDFLRRRGAVILFAGALGKSIETLLGRRVSNRFRCRFRQNWSPDEARATWRTAVDSTLTHCSTLEPALSSGLRNEETVRQVYALFEERLEGLAQAAPSEYLPELRGAVEIH